MQQSAGFIALSFGVLDFLAQSGQLSLLIVELPGVALQQRFFLGAAAQCFHVFAQAALIVFGIAAFIPSAGPVNLLAVGAALVTAGLIFG